MKLLKNINSNVKKIPVTIILITILAIILTIDVILNSNVVSYLRELVILLIITIFFVEVLFEDKKKRCIGYILAIIFSILLNHMSMHYLFLKCCRSDFSKYMEYVKYAYIIGMLSISIFIIYRKSRLNLHEYINVVLNNILKVLIIYFVNGIGILFIVILFDGLLSDYINISTISEVMYIVLFSTYFIPSITISLIDIENKKITNLFRVLSLDVFLPVGLISIITIYFYIFKVLITGKMPNNFIFMYVAVVFIVGLICYFICKNYEHKFNKMYTNLFGYIYILPVILQIYSIYIRFKDYGLTPLRYLTYMFILFEIITLVLIIYKKGKKLENIFIVVAVISIISTLTPFNLVRLSNLNQQRILEENYKKQDKDYYKALSAYEFLKKSVYGSKYISEEIDEKMNNSLKDKHKDSISYLYNKNENIDISGYSNMVVTNFNYNTRSGNIKNVVLKNQKTKESIMSIDIEDYIKGIISKLNEDTDKNELFSNNNEIIIDDNKKLVLYYLYVRYDEYDIKYVTSKAYLLEK